MKPPAIPSQTDPERTPRDWFFLGSALGIVGLFAAPLMAARVLTGFRARRFCAETAVGFMSRLILRLGRIQLLVRGARPSADEPVFYMPNHPSTADVFVLTALRLPNTRFFLSRAVWKYPPLAAAAWAMGVFFTPPQSQTQARIRCFQEAEARLRASGESILGSPEGAVTAGGLGRFNRGVFHLATLLRRPIVPIYISFPPGKSPGRSFTPSATAVEVCFLPPIPTRDWRLEDLEANKERVRQIFLDHEKNVSRTRGGNGPERVEARD